MKMPRKILVLGRPWKIKYVKKVVDDDGTKCHGLCKPDEKIILIEKGPSNMMKETFFHEWFHAVWYELGMQDEEVPEWIEHIILNGVVREQLNDPDFWAQFFQTDYIHS